MEKGKCSVDPHEEVRKLQEKVRELQLQLSQKSTASARNGISDSSTILEEIDEDISEGLVPVFDVDLSSNTWLVSSREDPRSEQEIFTALLRDGARLEKNLYAAICNAEQDRRKNIDSRTFTRPKKRMGRPSLELFESISALSKPSDNKLSWDLEANGGELDNMTCSFLESSLMNSVYSSDSPPTELMPPLAIVNKKQKVAPLVERRKGSLVISEKIEISAEDQLGDMQHDNGNNLVNHFGNVNYPDLEGVTEKNHVFSEEDVSAALLESADFSTSLIDSTLMDGNLMDTIIVNPKPKLNTSRIHQLNRTYTPSPPPCAETSMRKASIESLGHHQSSLENLNHTFVKEDERCPNLSPHLNSTYSHEMNGSKGSHGGQRIIPSVPRPGSTDSGGGDDDQLSSTSESSHTSANRLMSMGDVQHIARLQEESLVMSTPVHHHFVKMMDYAEDSISPITRFTGPDCGRSSGSSELQTVGYCSDHSSRSPLSSLHSSPAGSPFGSSTALPGSNLTHGVPDSRMSYRPNSLLQRKNTYGLIPPRKVKLQERSLRPPAPAPAPATAPAPVSTAVPTSVPTNSARPTARSGLRPPMIRTGAAGASGASALPRPAGTGIPRPSSLSRIPPPKVRSSVSQPSRKEWTDECY